ncbi:MAG: UDP-3-O-(3-hydroxymyristoyl)glucosamine N-acyltransferase [Phycisphaerae bacterium]
MPSWPLTVREIAELLDGRVEGDDSLNIDGVAALDEPGAGKITFAADARRARRLDDSQAAAALVANEPKTSDKTLIRVSDVQQALAKLLAATAPPEDLPDEGVDATARVSPEASIADGVRIGPGVVVNAGASIGPRAVLCAGAFVGTGVGIGEDAYLAQGVVVGRDCVIGDRVRIGPNTVIGWDGFGYNTVEGKHHRIPHNGNVAIAEDVEIGACCCVDRAKFGSTSIGAGTKIDNLVQIAHNVKIGRGCLLAGQVGLAGSCRLGDYVVLGGSAGVRDNVTIGDGVQCAAYSAIAADVPDGARVAGVPAGPAKEQMRIITAQSKLPELIKRLAALESKVENLESPEDH